MNQVARLAFAVGENVFLPVGSYSIAIWLGVTPVWALVTAAGVSLTVNAARWVITHEVTTLGLIVLVNRPGESGDSSAWEAWGHAGRFDEAVPAGVAGAGGADGR